MSARKIRSSGNPFIERWEVTGSRGDEYIVSKRQDGTFACSCPAWKFARAPKKPCKHCLAQKQAMDGLIPIQPIINVPMPVSAPAFAPVSHIAMVSGERFTVRRKIREDL